MGLFSRSTSARQAEALAEVRGDDAPFESLRRTPRNARKTRTLDGNPDSPPPLDPAETAKTRARRRLIGAIALGLAAVVFVPMLFDRTPVATSDDIALSIPDRDTPFEGRRGVPDPARAPLKASSELPVATPQPAPAPPVSIATPPPDAESSTPTPEATPAPEPKSVAKIPDHMPPATKPAPEPPKAAAPGTDDPKALAALEGRPEAAAPAGDTAGKTFAVQVAAFSAADRARGLRDQLVSNGLKSYTESVSTSQGLRVRVRLGPFASRDAADRARQKLKTMKLDGSVVPL